MARPRQAWRLIAPADDGAPWTVRFTHAGRRYHRSTTERDKAAAAKRAAQIYADALEGRLDPPPASAADQPLDDLLARWLLAAETTCKPATLSLYETYARAHWLPRWPYLSKLTTAAVGTYQRERLGQVTRVTVRKERTALRRFVEWLKEQGHHADELIFPKLPARATGVRSGTKKAKATHLDAREVAQLLEALPEWSPRPSSADGRPIRLRGFFELLWETGLRPATVEALVLGEHWRRGERDLKITEAIDKAAFAREVPLSARAVELLEQAARGAEPGRPLFGSYDRRAALERAAAQALPAKARRLSVYDLRHARITHWLEQGHSLVAVAYLVGHRQITTTAIYTHGTARAAAKVVQPPARTGWQRSPAPLRRLRAGWDYGQDRGQTPKTTNAQPRGRARVLVGVLAVCAKGGT